MPWYNSTNEALHAILDDMGWPRDQRKGVPIIIEATYADVTGASELIDVRKLLDTGRQP